MILFWLLDLSFLVTMRKNNTANRQDAPIGIIKRKIKKNKVAIILTLQYE